MHTHYPVLTKLLIACRALSGSLCQPEVRILAAQDGQGE